MAADAVGDTLETARDRVREGDGGPTPGAVVGRGRTAEIRAWGDDQVVKLYDAGLPSRLIDAEVVATRVAAEAGALAPAFGGRVLVDGRDGLVMERVEGTHMVALLRSAPWLVLRCAAQLARLQAAINARAGDGLEPLRERLDSAIRSASSLTPVARDGALAALAVLPDGTRLCHGDLHPENVILSPRGPVVLDWMTATAGDPAADVARTSLILSVASIPGASARDRALLRAGRGLLYRSFMRHRLRAGDVDGRSVRAWALPVAAARLAEGIDDERETLLDIVRRLSVERADRRRRLGVRCTLRAVDPPYLFPAYASTRLRAPLEPLFELPATLTERTGPLLGSTPLPATSADLTRQHGGEPLGERIVVHGRVLDVTGSPIAGQLVEIWQANAAGRYAHDADEHPAPLDPNFTGAGRCVTDVSGAYRFTTIRPGAYPWRNHPNAWRPAHIHFSTFGGSFRSRLVTQMYFPGDPLLEVDPIVGSIPDRDAARRLVCSLDLDATEPEWALAYRFDIVLPGDG